LYHVVALSDDSPDFCVHEAHITLYLIQDGLNL
jgi:hypothetical protein